MKKLLATLLILFYANSTYAVSKISFFPAPQATKDTCQSYSLAYALTFTPQFANVNTPKQMRELEQKIRKTIKQVVAETNKKAKKESDKVGTTSHVVWQEAVKRVSSKNLKLKLKYTNDVNQFYETLVNTTGVTSVKVLTAPLANAVIKKPMLTSVRNLEGNKYSKGHIVSLLGVSDGLPRQTLPKPSLEMMFLNSAVKANQKQFNMCSTDIAEGDKRYSASYVSTNNYTLKNYGGIGYLMMFIE